MFSHSLFKLTVRLDDDRKDRECRAMSTQAFAVDGFTRDPEFITLSNSQSTVTPRSLPLCTFHPITPEAVVAQRGCPRYIDFDVTATAYIHAARPRHRLSASLDIPQQACQLFPASFGTQHYFLAFVAIVYQPISTSDQRDRECQSVHFRHPRALCVLTRPHWHGHVQAVDSGRVPEADCREEHTTVDR